MKNVIALDCLLLLTHLLFLTLWILFLMIFLIIFTVVINCLVVFDFIFLYAYTCSPFSEHLEVLLNPPELGLGL